MELSKKKPLCASALALCLVLAAIQISNSTTFRQPWWKALKYHVNRNIDIKISYLAQVWSKIDQQMEKTCELWDDDSPEYVLFPADKSHVPNACSKVAMCNTTHCIYLEEESWLYTYGKSVPDNVGYLIDATMNSTKSLIFPKVISYSNLNRTELMNELHVDNWKPIEKINTSVLTVFDEVGVDAKEFYRVTKDIGKAVLNEFRGCDNDKKNDHDHVYHINGSLPFGCGLLHICDATRCLIYTHLSMQLATLVSRRIEQKVIDPSRIPLCGAVSNAIRTTRDVTSSDSHIGAGSRFSGMLSFNLPGYRYCGPGTIISIEDDKGGPTNDVDVACRLHDIDYMLGVDPETADLKFLQRVLETGSFLYPAFKAAFEAKRYFEKLTGGTYTTTLYFTPHPVAATLAHHFYFKSVYDSLNVSNTAYQLGKAKEDKWKHIVQDIWRGSCYVQKSAVQLDAEFENDREESPYIPHSDTTIPTATQIAHLNTPVVTSTEEDLIGITEDTLSLPTAPIEHKNCPVVISEVCTRNNENAQSFIELQKICPVKSRSAKLDLSKYFILIIQAGNPPLLLTVANLNSQKLVEVTSRRRNRDAVENFFVLGTNDVPYRTMSLYGTHTMQHFVPEGTDGTYAVVLLYRASTTYFVPDFPSVTPTEAMPLTDNQLFVIDFMLQDAVVYGQPCALEVCGIFETWLRRRPPTIQDYHFIPTPDAEPNNGLKPFQSINRCSVTVLPMQNNDWEIGLPTPLSSNTCPPIFNFPFNLRGTPLQSTAQKLLLNIHQFFTMAKENPEIMLKNVVSLTAIATNLNQATIRKYHKLYQENVLQTPGRKRNRPSPVMSTFDDFDVEVIKDVIAGYYKNNQPPFFDEIYVSSMNRFRDEGKAGTNANRCGRRTFKKLLRRMGFRYGRINLREVLLHQDKIVNKRGVYLKALRVNENGPKLPLCFTDETWIDPHARTGKAWVPIPGTCTPTESRRFTYASHKVSRGPRLIVLSAGGEDGMVHEATLVYKITGGQANVKLDYHDNVDSITYMKWFRTLCAALAEKGPHIIVIDNAPYHSKSDAPKQADKKAVLYNWIQNELLTFNETSIKPESEYRKFELWNMVKSMKETTDHYVIDKEAIKYGHQILRLPPYNCDLNPIELLWKDLKDYIRKHNPDQKIDTVKMLAEVFLLMYTPDQWKAHIRHVDGLRATYWENDGFFDDYVNRQPVIVPLTDAEGDDDDEVLDEDGQCEAMTIRSAIHDEGLLQIEEDDNVESYREQMALMPRRLLPQFLNGNNQ